MMCAYIVGTVSDGVPLPILTFIELPEEVERSALFFVSGWHCFTNPKGIVILLSSVAVNS